MRDGVEDTEDDLELKIARQRHSSFTSILLWFDREITDLDHAWLLDSTIEWFFHKSRIRRYRNGEGKLCRVGDCGVEGAAEYDAGGDSFFGAEGA